MEPKPSAGMSEIHPISVLDKPMDMKTRQDGKEPPHFQDTYDTYRGLCYIIANRGQWIVRTSINTTNKIIWDWQVFLGTKTWLIGGVVFTAWEKAQRNWADTYPSSPQKMFPVLHTFTTWSFWNLIAIMRRLSAKTHTRLYGMLEAAAATCSRHIYWTLTRALAKKNPRS